MILDAINLVKDVLFVTFLNVKKVAERIKQKRATRINNYRPPAADDLAALKEDKAMLKTSSLHCCEQIITFT
jgi:hypothetical protein